MVEGARLESVCRGNSTVGSNPTLSESLNRESAAFRLRSRTMLAVVAAFGGALMERRTDA